MSSKGIQLKHKIIIGVLSLILIVSTMMAVNLSKATGDNNLAIHAYSGTEFEVGSPLNFENAELVESGSGVESSDITFVAVLNDTELKLATDFNEYDIQSVDWTVTDDSGNTTMRSLTYTYHITGTTSIHCVLTFKNGTSIEADFSLYEASNPEFKIQLNKSVIMDYVPVGNYANGETTKENCPEVGFGKELLFVANTTTELEGEYTYNWSIKYDNGNGIDAVYDNEDYEDSYRCDGNEMRLCKTYTDPITGKDTPRPAGIYTIILNVTKEGDETFNKTYTLYVKVNVGQTLYYRTDSDNSFCEAGESLTCICYDKTSEDGSYKAMTSEDVSTYGLSLQWYELTDVYGNGSEIDGATSPVLKTTYHSGKFYSLDVTSSNDNVLLMDESMFVVPNEINTYLQGYSNTIVVKDGKDTKLTADLLDIYGNKVDASKYYYRWYSSDESDDTSSDTNSLTIHGVDYSKEYWCEIYEEGNKFGDKNPTVTTVYYYVYPTQEDACGYEKINDVYYLCTGNSCTNVYKSESAVNYTSSNTKVATVDKNGKVTAVGEGETSIKAKASNNDEYYYTVVVRNHKAVTDAATTTLTAGSHCKICGKVLTAQTTKSTTTAVATVPTLKVNETATASNGATVTALSDSTVSLKNKTVTSKQVIVPGSVTVNGKAYTVTTLQKDCFNGATVTKASLPTTITKINAKAFAGDKKLRVLNINSKKLTVSKDAFKGLKKSQVRKIKVTVSKKNMTKANYKKLKKQLIKAGIKSSNIKYR